MERIYLTSSNQQSALERASEVLGQGGIVIFPTETMYGVGVDATNPDVVSRLLRYKNRPAGKAISVLVFDQKRAEKVVEVNQTAQNLYKTFLPGPVTVISKDKGVVDSRLASELGTLGIRISSHPVASELAKIYLKPITATSANASGKARPYSINRLLEGLSQNQQESIDLILDAGELPHTEPSTVIDTTTEIQEVVRSGERIEELMSSKVTQTEEETISTAAHIMRTFLHALPEKTVVFALEGEMGAGKTRFAKGVAEALEITQSVSSPSYTIMKEYTSEKGHLVHMDLWRLENASPEELELDHYLHPKTVLVIEWAKPLLPYLIKNREKLVGYHVFIDIQSESERLIRIGVL